MSATLTRSGEVGCPSGLQPEPILDTDPLASALDLTPYVTTLKNDSYSLDLIVKGAHCGGCMAKIERNISAIENVTTARMNLSTLKLYVVWHGEIQTANAIVKTLTDLGYGAAPYEIGTAQAASDTELKSHLRAIAVAGFAAMNVMLLSIAVWLGGADMQASTHTIFHWMSAIIALPAIAYAGQTFYRSAFAALKSGRTNMDVPITLAVILASGLSLYETVHGNPDTYFDAAIMLLFLLLIGRYLDAKLRARTGAAAQRLAAMQSASATRILPDGSLETIATRQIKPGDTLLVPAGQRVPVDAKIITGTSEIDTHIATGESVPSLLAPGDMIYSGTINLSAPLTAQAVAIEADSFLSEISKLVELGEQSKSRFVKIADRAARAYVPVVHSLALLTFIGWILAGGELRTATLNAIAVLIITCPCALGLAVPAVQVVASGRLFKAGVFIKSGDVLERLAEVKWAIFDKTGTLTKGDFALTNTDSIPKHALEIASALAQNSAHPIAKALRHYPTPFKAEDVTETAGQGLSGIINGKRVKFCRVGGGKHLAGAGLTQSWLQIDDAAPIAFTFSDVIRSDAAETLEQLDKLGLTTEMLSGDTPAAAQKIAMQLGISRAQGGISPAHKNAIIATRTAEGRYPLMVGDGINDAPALANAHVSASLATASDISRSASDIILQGDKLSGLPIAIKVARSAQRRVIENLSLAVIYNMIAVPLAVFGFITPLIAALAMSGSSLLVTLNALRLYRFKDRS